MAKNRMDITSEDASINFIPTKCIIHCLKQGEEWRFAALYEGKHCSCMKKPPPAKDYTRVSEDQCESVCLGDESQFCGGEKALAVWVATCPDGTRRYGDKCLTITEKTSTIEEKFMECMDLV